MDKTKRSLKAIVLLLIFLIVGAYIWHRHVNSSRRVGSPAVDALNADDLKRAQSEKSGSSDGNAEEPLSGFADGGTHEDEGLLQQDVLEESSRKEIQKCWGKEIEATNLEELLFNLFGNETTHEVLNFANYHFESADGVQRRLHIEGVSGGKALKVKLFREDAEGLPELQELPEELRAESVSQDMVDSYLAGHKIGFRERSWSFASQGHRVDLKSENERIKEAHVVAGTVDFGCLLQGSSFACRCLSAENRRPQK